MEVFYSKHCTRQQPYILAHFNKYANFMST